MREVATGRRRGHADRDDRMAYFDRADRYTPYLATDVAGGAQFLVRTEDKHIGRSLFSKQSRGELAALTRAVRAIKALLGPDATKGRSFIDVGANIGTTTIPALVTHGFETAVAIEPEPENLRVLRLNVLLNDLEDRVTALGVAASNEVGRSELVVDRSRGGKHWIATDRSKLRRKNLKENTLVAVETVTLDHLADTGVIDPERTGLLWMDAEAHEGHILEGASQLLVRVEWNPVILYRVGDRGKIERAVADGYTHFAALHRNLEPNEPSFPLQTVDRLPDYAQRFLDRSKGLTKTDVVVLRLDAGVAEGITDLNDLISSVTDDEDALPAVDDRRGLLSRLRSRLGRR
jgi:FkbM family methyltransferase